MIFPVKADLVVLIKGIVDSIQPFATAHTVKLNFESEINYLQGSYQPEQITPDLTQLICRVITFTPQSYEVTVRFEVSPNTKNDLHLIVANSGVNLSLVGDIRAGLKHEVVILEQSALMTSFLMKIPIGENGSLPGNESSDTSHSIIRPYYSEIRNRLKSHFRSIEKLEEAAVLKGGKEGVFLKKVNTVIQSHILQEGFKAESLARSMALSRTQLFRKIKSLTRMAPGQYIRYVRLEKAKKLLEQGGLNVSEVAYSVGFASNSHFTRAFQKHFGFNPSSIKHE